jgi:CubicO group peptidase (beta-lactamase class C family)
MSRCYATSSRCIRAAARLLPLLAAAVAFGLPPLALAGQTPPGLQPQPPQEAAAEPIAEGVGPIDAAELASFLDGLMAAHLTDHQVAGATVAVVRDGALLFSGGYGFVDAEGLVPVDPATTLFRIGSVTKTFTWTAVLQLRDRGLLDLDADVNDYLDFRIPDTFDTPITLRHIMTHTPGFEDRVFGLFGETSEIPRGEWLRRNLPARVRPPGTLPSYSNYASALAGYIVERVSGRSWEAYVESEILEPLGMVYATPREPLPEPLVPHMSGGFVYQDGRFVAKPFERIGAMGPAGSVSASAEAMAAYMIAHLDAATAGAATILSPASAREMQERAFAPEPRVNAMALGFYEMNAHDVRIVGHGGGTQWFFTDMALLPEERLGVFVSYNSAGGAVLPIDRFMRAFVGRFFPVDRHRLDGPPAGWAERAPTFEGRYQSLRRPHTTFEKLLGLSMQMTVTAGDSGDIVVSSPMMPGERMLEVEPGHFRSPDGFREAAFSLDERTGRPLLFLSMMPPAPAEKVGLAASPTLHLLVLLFWLLTFLSILVVLPARYLLQRRVAEVRPLRGPERWLRWAALATAVLALAFLLGLAAIGDTEAFLAGTAAGAIRVALLFPVLAIPATLILLAGTVLAYRRRYWGHWTRAHFTLVAIAAVAFLVQLQYWNLIGWRG